MIDSLRRLLLLVIVAGIVGVVVAGLLLPLVAAPALVSDKAIDMWNAQRCDLTEQPPLPQRTHIVADDGSRIADFYYQNRVSVPFQDIPVVMRRAIVATEDSRFYEHNGVDVQGILRAVVTNGQAGEIREGGSTLTQQYVKNLFLLTATTKTQQQAAVADTMSRKIREAKCAMQFEQHMSKDQILTGYLNIAYFGEGAYGISAAAARYFGVAPQRLTLPQAALIAGIVKNPYAFDPILHPDAARNRRATVLQRMAEVGDITEVERASADAAPLGLHPEIVQNGCETSRAPYFCEWVVDEIQSNPAFGDTVAERTQALLRGGLTIRTTLDWQVQRAAEKAVQKYVPASRKKNPRGIASAVVVVQPGTGAVQGMAVNLPFGNGKGQNSVNLALGGSTGFQGGSTFKMFTLVTALEQHVPVSLRIHSPQTYCSKVTPDYSCDNGRHGVKNAGDSESGTFDLITATADSVNTYYVQLIERIGVMPVVHTAQSMGIDFEKFPGWGTPTSESASVTLGGWGVTPLEMAEAYATLAARGKHCPAFALVDVRNPDGSSVALPPHPCRQVIDKAIADTATEILTHVIVGPGSHTAPNAAAVDRPAAGKTGTTDRYAAAWFVGYTPQLAAAVWVGDPKGSVPGLRGFTLDGGSLRDHMFGGDEPAQIWAATVKAASENLKLPIADFPPADPIVEYGAHVSIPDVTGMTPADAIATLSSSGLSATVAPTRVPSAVPDGRVASTDPVAGSDASPGESVTVFLGNGTAPTPSPTVTPSGSATPGPGGSPSPTPQPGSPTPTVTPPSPNPPTPSPSHRRRHKPPRH